LLIRKKERDMKSKRYSTEQIIRILREKEAGASVTDLCRKYGMCEQTYYNWQKKYDGMEVNDARRLKDLEKENARLKKMVAELSLDKVVLEELLTKNF